MAEDRLSLLLEAERRGMEMSPDDRALLAEARKRGMAPGGGSPTPDTAASAMQGGEGASVSAPRNIVSQLMEQPEFQVAAPDIGAMVSGEGRIPPETQDLSTFEASGASIPEQMKLAVGFMLNPDPAAQQDMLRNTLDDVSFSEDSLGNVLVSHGGETGFLNRPGLDFRDVTQFGADVAKFAPAGRIANTLFKSAAASPGFFSRLGRRALATAGAGGSAAATETGSQRASDVFGNEQDVNRGDAGAVGTLSGLAELGSSTLRRFTPRAIRSQARAGEFGLGLQGQPAPQVHQIARAAQERMPGGQRRAVESMPPLRDALRGRAAESARQAGRKFDEARATRSAVKREGVDELNARLDSLIDEEGFDLQSMPRVNRSLNRLKQLTEAPEGSKVSAVKLNELAKRMRQIGRASAKGANPEERLALGRMYREMDDWMVDQFNRDMISGDPSALKKWKDARAAWRLHQETFNDEKVIADLIHDKNASPETMRKWLLGAGELPGNTQAGPVVRKMKEILGPDSPEIGKIQAEVVLDIANPLTTDPPNLSQFIKRYDKFRKNMPTLADELFGSEAVSDLDDIARFAKGVVQRPGATVEQGSTDVFGRLLDWTNRRFIGHELAKGQARLQATGAGAGFIRRQLAGRQGRKQILREFLGEYDPTEPLVQPGAATTAAGAMESRARQGEEAQEQQDQPTGGEQRE